MLHIHICSTPLQERMPGFTVRLGFGLHYCLCFCCAALPGAGDRAGDRLFFWGDRVFLTLALDATAIAASAQIHEQLLLKQQLC